MSHKIPLDFPDNYRQDPNVVVLKKTLQRLGYKVTPRTNELFEITKGDQYIITLLQAVALNGFHVPYITIYKHDTKLLLNHLGVVTAKGWLVSNRQEAVHRAQQLHYRCVIKPNSGAFGDGVMVLPTSVAAVHRAYRNARAVDREQLVLVEQYVPGKDLRIITLNGHFLAALHREAANIVGDGQHTIQQLIVLKNKVRLRKHLPLINLKTVQKKLNIIPRTMEVVQLLSNNNISTGGDSYGVTQQVHASYHKITKKICTALQMNCVGFDWHVQDWTKPYNPRTDYILEINSSPDLYIHHWLWSGQSDPVAEKIAAALVK